MPVEASEEVSDRARANVATFSVALGLDVDAIESERVLIDDAINTVIATAVDCVACIDRGSTITHAER